MVLELYLDLASQPCRSVYLFAKRNGLPFEFKPVEFVQGQHLGDAFRKVNPLRKLPALKDGDFTLAESVAILLYMTRKFKTPDHWYPSDLQRRARVDEYLSWQHMTLRMAGSKLHLAKLAPLFLDHPFPPEKLEEFLKEMKGVLKSFEETFLQDRPFIAGNEISLADLVAIVEIMQPVAVGYDLFEGRPKLAAWRSRVEEAIGKELLQEAHEKVFAPVEALSPEMKEKLKHVLLKYVQ